MIVILLSDCLQYSNSAINPVLYAFLSDNFKKSFRKACHCDKREVTGGIGHMQDCSATTRSQGRRDILSLLTIFCLDEVEEVLGSPQFLLRRAMTRTRRVATSPLESPLPPDPPSTIAALGTDRVKSQS